MKLVSGSSRKKIILVPYPAQGHVTPMLKLASVLVSYGLSPVIITPEFIHRRVAPQIRPEDGISCMSIPDGLDVETPRDFLSIERAMENYMPFHLENLIRRMTGEEEVDGCGDGGGTACVVIDLLASWAIDVGRRCGIEIIAGFWPSMHANYRLIAAIPDMIRAGIISEDGFPLRPSLLRVSPGQLARISTEELPWLIGSSTARNARFKFWTRTLNRTRTLKWLLINTFPDESSPNCIQLPNYSDNNKNPLPQVLQIGPLNMQGTTKNATFWDEDLSCLNWLNEQAANSVVYISFGSWVSPVGETKVNNLALSLEASKRPFIWVLNQGWRDGLPKGYTERISNSKQGKIVSWVPQVKVLQHRAVGCYLTHCGWNSAMEAIQWEKKLLCYPIAGDQFVNCAYIVNVWRIGIRIKGLAKKEIEQGLKILMEDNGMSYRIRKLNEKMFGEEAESRTKANLTRFFQYIRSSQNSCMNTN